MIRVGKSYRVRSRVFKLGVLANADSTPSAALYRNGTLDGAVTVTPTLISTGIYEYAWTIPSGYAQTDSVIVVATATINGTPDPLVVFNSDVAASVITSDVSGGGGTSLTGPYTRTITVTDSSSSDPIENAKVRLYRTGETGSDLTDASGVVTFTTEAATWSYAVTANGYAGATGTIVISADGSTSVTLTSNAVTPATTPLCAVAIHVLNQYGTDLEDEPVEITFIQWGATASATPPVLSPTSIQTTDADGLVQVNLLRLADYKVVYGTAPYTRRVDISVPDASTYEVEI